MKRFYEVKNIGNSVRDVDDKTRRVKVAISQVGSKDLDNDVIEKGAYTKTIAERGPKGANLIWHLTDHNASLKNAVGKFSALAMEGDYLVGITDIPKTNWGNDVLEFYKTGTINQHSIGFRTIKREPVNAGKPDEYSLIKEVLLYEGSAVLWGANPNTPTLSVGKSEVKEIHQNIISLNEEVNGLIKTYKQAKLTDETFEFIEIQITQKQEQIKQLLEMATQPASAVEPDSEDLASVIKQYRQEKFK